MRSLSLEAREERRRQVVGLRRRGWTYEALAEETGLSRTGVFSICPRHAQESTRGLKDKRRTDQINEAFERMERSDVRYRFVVDMANLKEMND
jgi:uncharacterized protein YerC